VRFGNTPPVVRSPTRAQQEQLKKLETKLKAAEDHFAKLEPELNATQAKWEKTVKPALVIDWSRPEGLIAHFPLDGDASEKKGHCKGASFKDGAAAYVGGPLGKAASLDGKRYLDAGDVADLSFYDRFSFGAWVRPAGKQGGTVVSRMADNDRGEG